MNLFFADATNVYDEYHLSDDDAAELERVSGSATLARMHRNRSDMSQIQADAQRKLDSADHIANYLVQQRTSAAENDAAEFARIREQHLVPGSEVPPPTSALGSTVNAAALSAHVGDSAASQVVLARDLIHDHTAAVEIMHGTRAVGQKAPAFRSTDAQPHYMTATSSAVQREATSIRRFTQTIGGLGRSSRVHSPSSVPPPGGRQGLLAPPKATHGANRAAGPVSNSHTEVLAAIGRSDDMGLSLDDDAGDLAVDLGLPRAPPAAAAAPRKVRTAGLGTGIHKAALGSVTLGGGATKPVTQADVAANEAVAQRMARPLAFLRNPRDRAGQGIAVTRAKGRAARETAAKLSVVPDKPPPSLLAAGGSWAAAPGTVAPQASTASAYIGPNSVVAGVQNMHRVAGSSTEALAGPLLVSPFAVRFTGYQPGDQDSATVVFRNNDTLSRNVRFLPPSTPYFSMDPPSYGSIAAPTSGVIAPGMSVHVRVHFCPDSLADYSDELVVITEGGKFRVPISAGRAAPQLSLPSALDAGLCLQHGMVTTSVPFRNTGQGEGRFRVFRGDQWPSVDDSEPPPAFIEDGPFTISPTEFALGPGGSAAFKVRFRPPHVGHYTCRVVILCDNADVTEHELRGICSTLRVGVTAVSGTPLPRPVLSPFDGEALLVAQQAVRHALAPHAGRSLPHTGAPRLAAAQAALASVQRLLLTPSPAGAQLTPLGEAAAHVKAMLQAALAAPAPGGQQAAASDTVGVPPLAIGCSSSSEAAWGACWNALSECLRRLQLATSVRNPPLYMRFDSLLPGGSIWKTITVRNDTPMALPFEWVVLPQRAAAPQLSIVPVGPARRASNEMGGGTLESKGGDGGDSPPASPRDNTIRAGSVRVGSKTGSSTRVHDKLRVQVATGDGELTLSTAVGDSVRSLAKQLTPHAVRTAEIDANSRALVSARAGPGSGLRPPAPPLTLVDAEEHGTTLAFSVEPATGSLPPHSEATFQVFFTPPAANASQATAYLLIDGVPYAIDSGSSGTSHHAAGSGMAARVNAAMEGGSGQDGNATAVPTTRVTATQLVLQGSGEAPSVLVTPPVAHVPRPLLAGEVQWTTFRLNNASRGTVSVWFGNAAVAFRPGTGSRYTQLMDSVGDARAASCKGWLRIGNWSTGSNGDTVAGPFDARAPLQWPPPSSRDGGPPRDDSHHPSAPSTGRDAEPVPPPVKHSIRPVAAPRGGRSQGVTQGCLPSLPVMTADGQGGVGTAEGSTAPVDWRVTGGAVVWVAPTRAAISAGGYLDVSVAMRAPAAVGQWAAAVPAYVFPSVTALTAPSAALALAAEAWEAATAGLPMPRPAAAASREEAAADHFLPLHDAKAWTADVPGRVPHQLAPGARVNLRVQGSVTHGNVRWTQPEVNLGLTKVSENMNSSIRVANLSHKPLAFRVEHQARPEVVAAAAERRRHRANTASSSGFGDASTVGGDDFDDDDDDTGTVMTMATSVSDAQRSLAGQSIASAVTASTVKSVVKDGIRFKMYPAAGVLPPWGETEVELVSRGGRIPQRIREFLKVSAVVVEEDLLLLPAAVPGAGASSPRRPHGLVPASMLIGGSALPSPGPNASPRMLYPKFSRASLSWYSVRSSDFVQPPAGGAQASLGDMPPPSEWIDVVDAPDQETVLTAQGSHFAPVYTRVRGEVQMPKVVLEQHRVDLGLLFVGMPVSTTLTLRNLSNLTSEFRTDGYTGLTPRQVALLMPAAEARRQVAGLDGEGVTGGGRSFDDLLAAHTTAQDKSDKRRVVGFAEPGSGRGGASGKGGWDSSTELGVRLGQALQGMVSEAGIRYIASFSPAGGQITAKQTICIKFTLTPVRVGRLDALLTLDVRGMLIPLATRVTAHVRPLTLAFGVTSHLGGVVAARPTSTSVGGGLPGLAEDPQVLALQSAATYSPRPDTDESQAGDGQAAASSPRAVDAHEEFVQFLERMEADAAAIRQKAKDESDAAAMARDAEAMTTVAPPAAGPSSSLVSGGEPQGGGKKRSKGVSFGGGVQGSGPAGAGGGSDRGLAASQALDRVRAVEQMRDALDAAEKAGARLGVLPPVSFGEGFETFTRRSVTLTVFNTSGVPSALHAQVKHYPVWEGPVAAAVEQADAFQSKLQGRAARSERRTARAAAAAEADQEDPLMAGPLLMASVQREAVLAKHEGAGDAASVSSWGSGARPTKLLHAAAFERASRLQSHLGQGLLRKRDEREVMREQLGLQNGIAFSVSPDSCTLPPFGSATVTISCVSDFPGEYVDELELNLDGAAPVRVPLQVRVQGTPLRIMADVAGLQMGAVPPPGVLALLKGSPAAGGVSTGGMMGDLRQAVQTSMLGEGALAAAQSAPTVPLLHFGQIPTGDSGLQKVVTLENTAPLDAHVTWHLVREPHSAPPLVKLSLTPNASGRVSLGLALANERSVDAPPPFRVTPSRGMVPAHGKTSFTIEAWPEPADAQELAASKREGWVDALLRRGMLTVDTVWSLAGTPPQQALLEEAQEELSTQLAQVAQRAERSRTMSVEDNVPGRRADMQSLAGLGDGKSSDSGSVDPYAEADLGGLDTTASNVAAGALRTGLQRDVLRLRLAVQPVQPALWLDKQPMAPGHPPIVKFAAWITAPAGHDSYRRTLTFTNSMEVPLSFALAAIGPFHLVRVVSNAPRLPPAGTTGRAATLARRGFKTHAGAGTYQLKTTAGGGRTSGEKPRGAAPLPKSTALLRRERGAVESLPDVGAPPADSDSSDEEAGPSVRFQGSPGNSPEQGGQRAASAGGRQRTPLTEGATGAGPWAAQANSDVRSAAQTLRASAVPSTMYGGALKRTMRAQGGGDTDGMITLPPLSNLSVEIIYVPPNVAGGTPAGHSGRSAMRGTGLAATSYAASARSTGSRGALSMPGEVADAEAAAVLQTAAAKFYHGKPGAQVAAVTATRRALGQEQSTLSSTGTARLVHGTAMGGVLDAGRPALRDEELGAVRIGYSNGSTQYVVLRAQRLRPLVVVQPPVVDFGIVHVENQVHHQLAMSNPTVVTAQWSITHIPWPPSLPKVSVDVGSLGLAGLVTDSQQDQAAHAVGAYAGVEPVDDPSVFGFDAEQGSLAGPTAAASLAQVAHVRPEEPGTGGGLPAYLQAGFVPEGPHVYRSRFRVVVKRGDSFDFVLWGRGSLQEGDAAAARPLQ